MDVTKRDKLIILSNDKAADRDAFGLDAYIQGLSDFIRDCVPPMTVAIQGSWGSGKTSMMKMIAQRLAWSAVCVEFNTWQYSQFSLGERLPVIFYESLIEKLAQGGAAHEKDEEKQKLMDLCKRAARTAVKLGASLTGLDDTLDIVTEGMAKKAEKTPSVVETVERLRSGFQALVEKRCTEEGADRVVIFIDDLDRLSPERAVELMEVLKIVMECDKCVFVLAIDYDVVLRGVRAKYGADFAQSKGRSFFDKLIQVPVTLPVAQYQMNSYIRGLLDSITGGMGEALFSSQEELGFAVSFVELAIGHNPRSVKRLFNAYTLNLYMLRGQEVPLMTKELLFAVECLQLGFESVYHYLCQVAADSDDLNTFLSWFKDPGEAALDKAMAADPILAEKLALGEYSPLRRGELRQFIQALYKFTRSILWWSVSREPPELDTARWLEESGYTVGALGLSLYEWEALQDALDFSTATALGTQSGRRLAQVPPDQQLRVAHNFFQCMERVLDCPGSEEWPPIDRSYETRRQTVEDRAAHGLLLRESAVLSFLTRDLGWGVETQCFDRLEEARADPEGFVERLWEIIQPIPSKDNAKLRQYLLELLHSPRTDGGHDQAPLSPTDPSEI